MKIDFSEEEMYIIERTMDNLLTEHLRGIYQNITVFGGHSKERKVFVDKMFSSWTDTYDKLEKIIAKFELVRTKD